MSLKKVFGDCISPRSGSEKVARCQTSGMVEEIFPALQMREDVSGAPSARNNRTQQAPRRATSGDLLLAPPAQMSDFPTCSKSNHRRWGQRCSEDRLQAGFGNARKTRLKAVLRTPARDGESFMVSPSGVARFSNQVVRQKEVQIF